MRNWSRQRDGEGGVNREERDGGREGGSRAREGEGGRAEGGEVRRVEGGEVGRVEGRENGQRRRKGRTERRRVELTRKNRGMDRVTRHEDRDVLRDELR